MIFSPIGEGFFFRGMLHESVKVMWGATVATWVNAMAFGGIHLLQPRVTMGQHRWSPFVRIRVIVVRVDDRIELAIYNLSTTKRFDFAGHSGSFRSSEVIKSK
jgi:membrane protease YdiL (CAAX protease family)